MKKIYSTLIFSLISLFSFSQTIQLESFATGFTNPIEMVNAGDSRLFVVEQNGIIKILNSDGTINPTAFLNISSNVLSGGEQGLLGLAFASEYTTTGRFYVNYINNSGNTVISRFNVSANPDIANTSETVLLTIAQPFTNHNGGKMAFGPDGYLYISTGDGGNGGDPGNRAQNTNELLGKILRIDVSGSTYTIPTSNPFSSSGGAPEVYAIGLRNPWKFSFDSLNGDLWIADVGQGAFEEIDKASGSGLPGDNYGWRCYEGINHDYNNSGSCPVFTSTISPVAEYDHSGGKCSITGGYIYRGTTYPDFSGKYFFADYCSNEIGLLTGSGTSWSLTLQTPNITKSWTSFGEDINGELYIIGGGNVYKIIDPNLSIPENEINHFKMSPNPSDGMVIVDFGSSFTKIKSIAIVTIQGKIIKNISSINTRAITFSTDTFAKGLYFVEITSNNNTRSIKKLIIN